MDLTPEEISVLTRDEQEEEQQNRSLTQGTFNEVYNYFLESIGTNYTEVDTYLRNKEIPEEDKIGYIQQKDNAFWNFITETYGPEKVLEKSKDFNYFLEKQRGFEEGISYASDDSTIQRWAKRFLSGASQGLTVNASQSEQASLLGIDKTEASWLDTLSEGLGQVASQIGATFSTGGIGGAALLANQSKNELGEIYQRVYDETGDAEKARLAATQAAPIIVAENSVDFWLVGAGKFAKTMGKATIGKIADVISPIAKTKFASKAVQKGAIEITSAASAITDDLINAATKKNMTKVFGSGVVESLSETAADIGKEAIMLSAEGKDFELDLGDVWKTLSTSFIVGSVAGGYSGYMGGDRQALKDLKQGGAAIFGNDITKLMTDQVGEIKAPIQNVEYLQSLLDKTKLTNGEALGNYIGIVEEKSGPVLLKKQDLFSDVQKQEYIDSANKIEARVEKIIPTEVDATGKETSQIQNTYRTGAEATALTRDPNQLVKTILESQKTAEFEALPLLEQNEITQSNIKKAVGDLVEKERTLSRDLNVLREANPKGDYFNNEQEIQRVQEAIQGAVSQVATLQQQRSSILLENQARVGQDPIRSLDLIRPDFAVNAETIGQSLTQGRQLFQESKVAPGKNLQQALSEAKTNEDKAAIYNSLTREEAKSVLNYADAYKDTTNRALLHPKNYQKLKDYVNNTYNPAEILQAQAQKIEAKTPEALAIKAEESQANKALNKAKKLQEGKVVKSITKPITELTGTEITREQKSLEAVAPEILEQAEFKPLKDRLSEIRNLQEQRNQEKELKKEERQKQEEVLRKDRETVLAPEYVNSLSPAAQAKNALVNLNTKAKIDKAVRKTEQEIADRKAGKPAKTKNPEKRLALYKEIQRAYNLQNEKATPSPLPPTPSSPIQAVAETPSVSPQVEQAAEAEQVVKTPVLSERVSKDIQDKAGLIKEATTIIDPIEESNLEENFDEVLTSNLPIENEGFIEFADDIRDMLLESKKPLMFFQDGENFLKRRNPELYETINEALEENATESDPTRSYYTSLDQLLIDSQSSLEDGQPAKAVYNNIIEELSYADPLNRFLRDEAKKNKSPKTQQIPYATKLVGVSKTIPNYIKTAARMIVGNVPISKPVEVQNLNELDIDALVEKYGEPLNANSQMAKIELSDPSVMGVYLDFASRSVVGVKTGRTKSATLYTLFHEMGHVIYDNYYKSLPSSVKTDFMQEISNFKKQVMGGEVFDRFKYHNMTSPYDPFNQTQDKTTPISQMSEKGLNYIGDREEFFANEVAKYFTLSNSPTKFGQFVRYLKGQLYRIYEAITGKSFVPTKTINNIMTGILQGRISPDYVLAEGDKNIKVEPVPVKRLPVFQKLSKQRKEDSILFADTKRLLKFFDLNKDNKNLNIKDVHDSLFLLSGSIGHTVIKDSLTTNEALRLQRKVFTPQGLQVSYLADNSNISDYIKAIGEGIFNRLNVVTQIPGDVLLELQKLGASNFLLTGQFADDSTTNLVRARVGFGSFINKYFNKDKDLSKYPKVTKYFKDVLDSSPDFAQVFKATTDLYKKVGLKQNAELLKSSISFERERDLMTRTDPTSRFSKIKTRLFSDFLEHNTVVGNLSELSERTLGRRLSPGEDPYLIRQATRGIEGRLVDFIEQPAYTVNGKPFIGLKSILNKIPESMKKDFGTFLLSKYLVARNDFYNEMITYHKNYKDRINQLNSEKAFLTKEELAPRANELQNEPPKPETDTSVFTVERAKQYLSSLNAREESIFDEASEAIYDWRDSILEEAKKYAPNFSEEYNDLIGSKLREYVPMQRSKDVGTQEIIFKSSKLMGKEIAQKFGNSVEQEIVDPIFALVNLSLGRLTNAGIKQTEYAAVKIFDEANKLGKPFGYGIVELPTTPEMTTTPQGEALMDEFYKAQAKAIKMATGENKINPNATLLTPESQAAMQEISEIYYPTVQLEREGGEASPYIFRKIRVDGKVRLFAFDKDFYKNFLTLETMDAAGPWGSSVETFLKVGRILASGLFIYYNPMIWAGLVTADILSYAINTKNPNLLLSVGNYIKYSYPVALTKKIFGLENQLDTFYNSSHINKFNYLFNSKDNIESSVNKLYGDLEVYDTTTGKITKAGKAAFSNLNNFVNFFYSELDEGPRKAEIASLAQYKDIDLANMSYDDLVMLTMAAKRITTDFSAQGRLTGKLRLVFPFINAALQGTRTALSRTREATRNRDYAYFARLGSIVALSALMAADLSEKEWYRNLTSQEKIKFLWIPKNENEAIRLKVFHPLLILGNIIAQTIVNSETSAKDIKNMVAQSILDVTGTDPFGLNPVLKAGFDLANIDTGRITDRLLGEADSTEIARSSQRIKNYAIRDNKTSPFALDVVDNFLRKVNIEAISPKQIDQLIRDIGGPVVQGAIETLYGSPKEKKDDKDPFARLISKFVVETERIEDRKGFLFIQESSNLISDINSLEKITYKPKGQDLPPYVKNFRGYIQEVGYLYSNLESMKTLYPDREAAIKEKQDLVLRQGKEALMRFNSGLVLKDDQIQIIEQDRKELTKFYNEFTARKKAIAKFNKKFYEERKERLQEANQ